jgi:deoxyribodipyrimidine photo-lyase
VAQTKQQRQTVQVVWFKRDLRVEDNEPLERAAAAGPVVPLYVFEPEVWQSADMSARHRWWITESLRELRAELASLGQPLVVRSGEICAVLEDICTRCGTFVLWSHEETGNGVTYRRDLSVLKWCRERGIAWNECRQFGVIRRLATRDSWSERWESFMAEPTRGRPEKLSPVRIDPGGLPSAPADFTPSSLHQLPGERAAKQCLQSFLYLRGEGYSGGISSPVSAAKHGSRLSPYLAWGNVSMRTVVAETRRRQAQVRALPPHERGRWLRSLRGFDARLHWHCHFIQKLESEPAIEHHCFIRSLDAMRDRRGNEEHLLAWCNGLTGYPFVDACMRYLRATGWLNFRMRAMLVSFASYDLFLDWRLFADFLAQQFLDYEPGIHYPQIQMQSGTTGINAIRMYDPVKQGYDHDPSGDFVRRWVPELSRIPGKAVHEPWRLTPLEQREFHFQPGVSYPIRVVDHRLAVRAAREVITSFRRSVETKRAKRDTLQRHGSRATRGRRHSASKRPTKTRHDAQLQLFSCSEGRRE